MCRLLGIISTGTVSFDRSLLSAPCSLASLLTAEPDGWGAAAYDEVERGWQVDGAGERAVRPSR